MLIFLTEKISATVSVYRDHPRSCGKDGQPATQSFVVWGSPPLMRERLVNIDNGRHWIRITPAHAGKTSTAPLFSMDSWDHPHSCGKDRRRSRSSEFHTGSPPLVRERHALYGNTGSYIGITPARAGKTSTCSERKENKMDHPRSCGKDLILGVRSVCSGGSPPLVRERRQNRYRRMPAHGITPARAGKTGTAERQGREEQDHPRSCGKDLYLPSKYQSDDS